MPVSFVLPIAALLIVLAERIWPADIQRGGWHRLGRNAAFGLALVAAGPLILFVQREAWGEIPPLIALDAVPGGIAIQFLIFDLWVYLTHRAYHEVPLLWRFHAPHHLDEAMDATTSFRFHPGELLISGMLRAVPCLAMGIAPTNLLVFEAMLAIAALFHHSNLKMPPRFEAVLSRVMVTPSIHWVHHHKRRADTDANYASLLSLWDRLFGTASPTPRRPGMAIGVEGEHDRTLAGLIAYPFSSRSRKIASGDGMSSGPSTPSKRDGSP
jgi:sterol desaturase/sphingolipid hydroxylase (fatty acid hydroxylase superfamily)